MTDLVTAGITVRLVDPLADTGELAATLSYYAGDPYAVVIGFGEGADAVQWVLGRELLQDGIEHPAGLGDVRLTPSRDGEVLSIELRPGEERAVLQAPLWDVMDFLARTYEVVPEGCEAVDVDVALEFLLGQEGGAR